MRISKMIVALLVSVVAVTAMTGVAVAHPENIVVNPGVQDLQPNQNPPNGAYATYTVDITNILPLTGGNSHAIKATTTLIVSGAGGNLNDLLFRFNHSSMVGGTSGWLNSGATYAWTDSGGTTGGDFISDSLTVDVMDTGSAQNIRYQFKVYDEYAVGSGVDDGEATVYGDSIPEFATIAIPAIAVLGLFLFFNKRKHKKD